MAMIKMRLARWLALALLAPVTALPAQTTAGQKVTPLPPSNDPADRLAANLLVLSQNPNDVRALTEAGLSAVAVGDGNAALAFLARAEAQSPGNGRIKAGLGSALLLLEKPTDALKLFGEASALGVPDHEIARDRGLAYDIRGDSRRAQRDYALALRHGDDDEVTRRYALSLGISGDRDKALDMLDPLLRKQDRAAWRARVFILAMNGALPAAESLAMQIMPGGSGSSMSPFLRKLGSLNAAERALAVNLGIMPSDGTRYAAVQTGDPYRSSGLAADALVPAGEPLGALPPREDAVPRRLEPDSRDPRRRPGAAVVVAVPPAAPSPADSAPVSVTTSTRVGKRLGPVDPEKVDAALRPFLTPPKSVSAAGAEPGFSGLPSGLSVTRVEARELPAPTRAPASAEPSPGLATAQQAAPSPIFEVPATAVLTAGSATAPSAPPPAQTAALMGPPAPEPAVQSAPATVSLPAPSSAPATTTPTAAPPAAALASAPKPAGLGAIIATIELEQESAAAPLPDAAALKAARAALQKRAAAAAKAEAEAKAAKEKKDAEQLAAKKNPARLWVQVATGANDAGLPLTWKRLREKAPDALKGLSASSASYKATNRLLVGPFKSQADAKKTVNALSKSGVSTFIFSSEAGQEIAKVATR